MVSLQFYVFTLLMLGAGSMWFITRVLLKQLRLLKLPFVGYDTKTQRTLTRFRRTLFSIVVAIIIISAILASVNILTLFVDLGRQHTVSLVGYLYSLGVHILLLMLSYLVARLYMLAANEKEMTDFTQHSLESQLKDQKRK